MYLIRMFWSRAICVCGKGWSYRIAVWSSCLPLRRGHPELVYTQESCSRTSSTRTHSSGLVHSGTPADGWQLRSPRRVFLRVPAGVCISAVHHVQRVRPTRQNDRYRGLSGGSSRFLSRPVRLVLHRSIVQLPKLSLFQLSADNQRFLQEYDGRNRKVPVVLLVGLAVVMSVCDGHFMIQKSWIQIPRRHVMTRLLRSTKPFVLVCWIN